MSDSKVTKVVVTPEMRSRVLPAALTNGKVKKIKPLTSGQQRALESAKARKAS
ncbi:MAG TPA: hypothetical protein VFK41_12065 [Nocardioidaceae bacterium]|nr:hypothetical protein [Nocardioidaceae bacterium]